MLESLFIALVSCIGATACAVAIASRDVAQPVNRLAAILLVGVAWWSACDVVRFSTDSAAQAVFLVRLGAPGWVFIGPLALHLLWSLMVRPSERVRRILPVSYAVAGVFLTVAWTTEWMHGPAVMTRWGWQPQARPTFSVYYLFTIANVVPGIWIGIREARRSSSPSDRSQFRWLAFGVALPFVVGSLTNVLGPLVGVVVPRLGTLAFAAFGGIVTLLSFRHGTSPLARGSFSRQILDCHPDGVALVLMGGAVATASEGLARLLGSETSAVVGQPIDDYLDRVSLDPERVLSQVEAELRRPDGSVIPVSVSTRPIRDKRGLPFAIVVVIRDLREVVGLRSRLVMSGRLVAIGQLAAGIAHEINNPMAFVRSNLAMLRSHWEKFATGEPRGEERRLLMAEGEELLAESLEGVERACSIVKDINGFAHGGTGAMEAVDLLPLLENTLRVASPQLAPGARVERELGPIAPVRGDSQELKQVFLNLLVNAAQAAGAGGCVRIRTEAMPGRSIVRIEDDGCGIPDEAMEQIFDPFYTTKPVGEGTGLGLFISYQIVRRHGGEIEVESEDGAGTRVSVLLPAAS